MRRSSLALAPIAPAVATLALAVFLSSCASGGAASGGSATLSGGSARLSYGYMIPGEQVATALGVTATDTLPELAARATLPSVLLTAIETEVKQGNWNDKCTRRFGGPTVYAVIFHRVCDSSAGPEADPQVVVGFTPDGRKRGTVRWSGASTVKALVPARRF